MNEWLQWLSSSGPADWILAVVGVGTMVAALKTLKAIERQVTANLDSVKVAQDSIVLTHRPKLVVRNVIVPGLPTLNRTTPLHDLEPDLTGQFWVTNAGATRAHLEQATAVPWVSTGLPMERPDLAYARDLGDRPPIEPGTSTTIAFEYPALRPEQAAAIMNRKTKVFLVGSITYRDDVGIRRTTYFCRLFDYDVARFFPVDDPDYEHTD